jgi:geranylgeranyl diphosphate synthase, type II
MSVVRDAQICQFNLTCAADKNNAHAEGGNLMDAAQLFEQALEQALSQTQSADCPPLMASAMRYAVFPGGARVRPRLVMAVAQACQAQEFNKVMSAAAAIEMLHCASLVHDDMPCFDGAAFRRGKPSVHVAYGERLALLTGDALIIQAFETVADYPNLARIIAQATGAPSGICAGQAWECEPKMDLVRYQRAKTGALFAACTQAGAAAAGQDHAPWRKVGMLIGEAFQVGDDLRDVAGVSGELGKPTGQDAANNLPNMVSMLGYEGAVHHLERLLSRVQESLPECEGREALGKQIVAASRAMVPKTQIEMAGVA